MKIALVYDRVNKWGGAERVLLALHKLFPRAPLYTAVYNPQTAPWADGFKVIPSFMQRVPFARTRHELYPWLTPFAFESFNFDKFDLVVSVTSADAKGILTLPRTKHVCYCLTPTRYLWHQRDEYMRSSALRKLTKPVIDHLKRWDSVAAYRPDYMISISKTVKKRVKKYYKRESEIIYPPVAISKTAKEPTKQIANYFLIVSRLVPYKRIDRAIEVFNKLQVPLVIIGKGVEEQKLKKQACKNIVFVSDLTDSELAWYYQNSQALIVPGEEDFGLSPVEAQGYGTPVIAYNRGGATETVIESKTGVFFSEHFGNDLHSVVQSFNRKMYNSYDCKENAKRFSKDIFNTSLLRYLDKIRIT